MTHRSQSWYASDSTRNLILLTIAVAIVASVLFVVGFVLPAVVSEINRGHLAVAEKNRLAQMEHRLQWESHIDRFFVLRCNTEDVDQ